MCWSHIKHDAHYLAFVEFMYNNMNETGEPFSLDIRFLIKKNLLL
jgi:hypothetical protein